ncbi:MAG TPA: copper resistance protein, partial [Stellaceae bacterium]|nr:copper resistance protein [Stellaceae bacterium]
MALLLDIFGFLSVVLRGLVLTAQSLTIGGIVFLALLAYPLRRELGANGDAAFRRCCRLLLWSASAFAAVELAFVLLECVVLAGTVDISLAEALGAEFALFGMGAAATAALAAAFARPPLQGWRLAA